MKLVYVDNNATTAVAPEVAEAMQPYLHESYFNPSSMYDPARSVAHAIAGARCSVAALIGLNSPSEVFFTSGATESNNWAIFGAIRANPQRRHIITTAVEHPSVLETCKEAARRGLDVTFLPVDRDGQLNSDEFVRALRPDTLLVSIMHANNETGVLFPIAELARLAKETDPAILVHTDATQSVGKVPLDLNGAWQHVDLLSLSGHKLHAPKGIGALFVRRGTPLHPYLFGGHQEGGHRAGTENVPHVVGLGRACELARTSQPDEERVRGLRDRLQSEIQQRVPLVEVNGHHAPRLPNTLNLAVHYIEGESILYQLNSHGICASSGSACTSGSLEPSHVLRAMQIPFTAIHGSVRFSLSRYTTQEEVDHIVDVFPCIAAALRKISPYWDSVRNQPRPGAPAASEPVRG